MEMKSPDITELSVGTYMHNSKSTDLIKPQGSKDNVEAQPGEYAASAIVCEAVQGHCAAGGLWVVPAAAI